MLGMSKATMWLTYFGITILLIFLVVRYFENPEMLMLSSEEFWRQSHLRTASISRNASLTAKMNETLFPLIVHQTWKSKSLPPHQTLRWREGCKKLNPQYEFKMFDDDDLIAFTVKYYPQYGSFLQALHGIYMVDMARIVLAFHFGGSYLDLDFYCHRPLRCLESYITKTFESQLGLTLEAIKQQRYHVLIVPREPLIHSLFIHHRSRVVINDIYMATPRHPFLEFFLNHFNDGFVRNNYTLSMRGPFSYNIDSKLDLYYAKHNLTIIESEQAQLAISPHCYNNQTKLVNHSYLNSSSGRSGKGRCELIFEVKPSAFHPLLDASNRRIQEGCIEVQENPKKHSAELQHACRIFRQGKYLTADKDTVLVHMWTHSFLEFSFLRGWYDQGTYVNVERTLPPKDTCEA